VVAERVETVYADFGLVRSYRTLLQAASARGHMEVVNVLLANRADVNVKGGNGPPLGDIFC